MEEQYNEKFNSLRSDNGLCFCSCNSTCEPMNNTSKLKLNKKTKQR